MTMNPEIRWHLIPDMELRHMLTSLDDDIAEQAENEIMRRRASAGGPRLPTSVEESEQ